MAEASKRSNQDIAMLSSAVLTVLVLFGAQLIYGHFSELSTKLALHDGSDAVQGMKALQRDQLASGPLSIGDAMQRLAEADRRSIPVIAPEASTEMAPAAGWMHGHAYVAPPAPLPEEPAPTEAVPAEGDATGDLGGEEGFGADAPSGDALGVDGVAPGDAVGIAPRAPAPAAPPAAPAAPNMAAPARAAAPNMAAPAPAAPNMAPPAAPNMAAAPQASP